LLVVVVDGDVPDVAALENVVEVDGVFGRYHRSAREDARKEGFFVVVEVVGDTLFEIVGLGSTPGMKARASVVGTGHGEDRDHRELCAPNRME
jgi:hypothetical protein